MLQGTVASILVITENLISKQNHFLKIPTNIKILNYSKTQARH